MEFFQFIFRHSNDLTDNYRTVSFEISCFRVKNVYIFVIVNLAACSLVTTLVFYIEEEWLGRLFQARIKKGGALGLQTRLQDRMETREEKRNRNENEEQKQISEFWFQTPTAECERVMWLQTIERIKQTHLIYLFVICTSVFSILQFFTP